MDKQQSLELFGKGKEVWNAWANEMLAEKQRFQNAGTWETEKSRWEEEARADFVGHQFNEPAKFSNMLFPSAAGFENARFSSSALFCGCQFLGYADFSGAEFYAEVSFGGDSHFDNVIFEKQVSFRRAKFLNLTNFEDIISKAEISFRDSIFEDRAGFHRARFYGSAKFNCMFKNSAIFHQSEFFADPDESDTMVPFADFSAVNCGGYFSLNGAQFAQVPDFTQAHFLEAPSLDRIIIGPEARENPTLTANHPPSPHGEPVEPREGGAKQAAILRQAQDEVEGQAPDGKVQQGTILRQAQDEDGAQAKANEAKEIPSRWRHLRRLATQGNDHENEQKFFAEELKSRRGVFDHPVGENWQNWWAGWLYQIFSDFGRSIWRPLCIWGVSTAIFAATYLPPNSSLKFGSNWQGKFECFNSSANPLWSALNLSASRALVLGSQWAQGSVSRSLQCLYGTDGQPFEIGRPIVHLPPWIVASGYIQPIFSATMIFLILLAIRNKFRIR